MTKDLTTRPSPSATRAVGILNFLAEHPEQSFKLTDIQRGLRLSRTTCHSILLALVEAGYVHRAADKSYSLGPVLVDIGRAASASRSPLQIAHPEMRRLADTYDVICSAVFREGNEMVVRDRAASVSHLGFSAPRGVRLPMVAPAGAVQFAWSKPSELDEWLGQAVPVVSKKLRKQIEQAIQFVHQHGFSFGFIEVQDHPRGPSWMLDESGRPIYRLATKLDDSQDYRVAVLQSWVFDNKGRIAFTLSLTGMDRPLSIAEIMQRGNDLRNACDRITIAIGGRRPPQRRVATRD